MSYSIPANPDRGPDRREPTRAPQPAVDPSHPRPGAYSVPVETAPEHLEQARP